MFDWLSSKMHKGNSVTFHKSVSLNNFEHLTMLFLQGSKTDGAKALECIANIDPKFVYSKYIKETILGRLIHVYGKHDFITKEMIENLIDRTDPSLLTPQIDYGVKCGMDLYYHKNRIQYIGPLQDIMYWCLEYDDNSKLIINTDCLAIARKLISKMDFSLPGSINIVHNLISEYRLKAPSLIQGYTEICMQLSDLLIQDLILKGAFIYSDMVRLDNKHHEATGINLLYLCNKVNVQENHIVLQDFLAFI